MVNRKQITLGDIANELKISKVAVSKALRDHPDISVATKKLVQETAKRLGYVPNFIARNLSSQRSNTIGLVVPKIAHHFFADAIEMIYKTAYENNYEVIMTVSQEDAEKEIHQLQTLLAMRVDGLLVSVTETTRKDEVFKIIKNRNVPLVFFDRIIEDLGFSSVCSQDEKGAYDAISYLIHNGYSKIAHIAGYDYTNIGRDRKAGFMRAINENQVDLPAHWVIEGGFGEEDGYRAFVKMFKKGTLPEVIFSVTYPVALGIIVAAEELKIKIPEDINIMCFGGSNYNRFIHPALSYVSQPVEDIGQTSVELLIEEIKNPAAEPQQIQLPTKLVMCETCLSKTGSQFYE